MSALDNALANHFREHNASKKKARAEMQRTQVHFKLRVLDLIEVYLHEQPANMLVLDIIPALFEVISLCFSIYL